jgi:hypothetical protein
MELKTINFGPGFARFINNNTEFFMCNLKRLAAIFVTILLTTGPVLAESSESGPGGTGGGNSLRSTRADLDEVIAHLDESLTRLRDAEGVSEFKITKNVLSPELSAITNRILQSSQFSINDVAGSYIFRMKFNIVNAPCYEGHDERDASTDFKIGAPVCLSAPRLARFPKSALKLALLPLLFHEMAHQHGYGEAEARAFQRLAEIQIQFHRVSMNLYQTRENCILASDSSSLEQWQEFINDERMILPEAQVRTIDQMKAEKLKGGNYLKLRCVIKGVQAGTELEYMYPVRPSLSKQNTLLRPKEKDQLMGRYKDQPIDFNTFMYSLTMPVSVEQDFFNEKPNALDPQYIMMLASKAAMNFIDQEVGRLQNKIKLVELK